MTERDDGPTLAERINRLFDVFRSRDESEQSVESVARSVSNIISRSVTAAHISALRTESTALPDPDVALGLARHFGVPGEYLTTRDHRAEELDKQLRLLAAARDAGVKRLALRGGVASDAVDQVVEIIRSVPPENT